MAFGAEVSAFTNLTCTFYLLNLAGNNEASLDEGLRVLRDFADGIEFAPEQIRKERGVAATSATNANASSNERSMGGMKKSCRMR